MSKGVCPLEDRTVLSTPYFKSNASTSKLPSLASNPKLGIFRKRGAGEPCTSPCDQVAARCTGYTTCALGNKKKQPVRHNWKGAIGNIGNFAPKVLCRKFLNSLCVPLGMKSLVRHVQSKKIETRNIWADRLRIIEMIQENLISRYKYSFSSLPRSCFLMAHIQQYLLNYLLRL